MEYGCLEFFKCHAIITQHFLVYKFVVFYIRTFCNNGNDTKLGFVTNKASRKILYRASYSYTWRMLSERISIGSRPDTKYCFSNAIKVFFASKKCFYDHPKYNLIEHIFQLSLSVHRHFKEQELQQFKYCDGPCLFCKFLIQPVTRHPVKGVRAQVLTI